MKNHVDKGGVSVREYRDQDLPGLLQLCAQLGYPARQEELSARLEAICSDHKQAVFVALAGDGAVAGWVHAFTRVLVVAGRQAELGGLVVEAGSRRQGVGRRLMARAEGWAREQGCQEMVVRSNVQRMEAHEFYPPLGYQPLKQQQVYFKLLSSH